LDVLTNSAEIVLIFNEIGIEINLGKHTYDEKQQQS
jgi:hypothetical protein